MTLISIAAMLCCGAGWRDSDWKLPGRNTAPFQAPEAWEYPVPPDHRKLPPGRECCRTFFPFGFLPGFLTSPAPSKNKKALHRISDERHCSTTALSLSLIYRAIVM